MVHARAVQIVLGDLRVATNGAAKLADRALGAPFPEIGAAALEERLGVAGIEPERLLVAVKGFTVVLGFPVRPSAIEPGFLLRRIGGDGAVEVRDRLGPSARFVESHAFFERSRRLRARAGNQKKKDDAPPPRRSRAPGPSMPERRFHLRLLLSPRIRPPSRMRTRSGCSASSEHTPQGQARWIGVGLTRVVTRG